jgi:hypothetical protein
MSSKRKLIALATGLTPTSIALAPRLANACAVCGLDGDGQASRAFKHSVLFMISVPYITFMIVGGVMYMAWRKARRGDSTVLGSNKTLG